MAVGPKENMVVKSNIKGYAKLNSTRNISVIGNQSLVSKTTKQIAAKTTMFEEQKYVKQRESPLR